MTADAWNEGRRSVSCAQRCARAAAVLLLVLVLLNTAPGVFSQQAQSQAQTQSANPTCTSFNVTQAECFFKGTMQVTAITNQLSAGQRVRLVGQPADSGSLAALSVSPVSDVNVDLGAGGFLELWNLQLGPVNFSSMPVDPVASLRLSGVAPTNCSSDCASMQWMAIRNSTILLDCTGWAQLQDALCTHGHAPGDAEVYSHAIHVINFTVGGVHWQDVLVLPACRMDSSDSHGAAMCGVRMEPSGSKLLDDMTALQASPFRSLFFTLPSMVVMPRIANVTNVTSNVTIQGASGAGPVRFDVNLQSSVFNVLAGGSLTFRSLVLMNMMPQTSSDPLGLLSCLMWFVSRSLGASQLSVQASMILVPPSEMDYLQATINPSKGVAPWTVAPSGLFSRTPIGSAKGNTLFFSSADGHRESWRNVSLQVLDVVNDPQAKLSWTGLDALLLPGEPQSSLVLTQVQSLGPSFNLLSLGAASNSQDAASNQSAPVRMLMSQSMVVDSTSAASMTDPVIVVSDTLIVGNILSPNGAIFDLAGFACMPDQDTSAEGYVTVGNKAPDQSATLYLRDLVLVNLQPASYIADYTQDPTGVLNAMANYTSLLWLFNIANRDTSAGDIPGQLVLQNVTLVVPATEFRVLLQILIGNLKYAIDPLAYQLLRQELGNMEMAAERIGSNIKYERNVGSVLLGTTPPSPDALGTITFPVFSWFGISGKQVTFTSKKPDAMTAVMLPVDASLWPPVGGPPPPPGQPDNPAASPATNGSGTQQSSSLSHNSWQLGLLVGLVVLVSMTLALAGWYVHRRIREKKTASTANSSLDSGAPDKDKAAVDVEAGAGAAPAAGMGAPVYEDPSCELESQQPCSQGHGHAHGQGSSASSSQRGSLIAMAVPHRCAAPSPFEAVALGLLPMAASGPELAQSSGHGCSGSLASGVPGEDGRMDTQALLDRIFRSIGPDAWTGGLPSIATRAPQLGQSSSGYVSSGINGMWQPPRPATFNQLSTPTGSMRHEIQRQMEVLRQELGNGQDETPQWDVQCQLGKGAHGVVYKGSWRGLDVAIKRVIFQVLGDPVADTRRKVALREAAINGTLHHPNIVTTYSHDMQPLTQMPLGGSTLCMQQFADWQLFIIQEYCDGGSLYTAIQERRFWDEASQQPRLPEVLAIVTDIASGCAYIHAKQIIHGDLKPDNVLLKYKTAAADSEGGSSKQLATMACTAKVADFGMSIRISDNNTHVSGIHHGTPLYVSPEILQDGRSSKAADVYSFGVIMWELYHGVSAWNHLVRMVGTPTRKSLPAFHPGMFNFDSCSLPAYAELGQACLSLNPAERPSFAQILEALQVITADLVQQSAQEGGVAGQVVDAQHAAEVSKQMDSQAHECTPGAAGVCTAAAQGGDTQPCPSMLHAASPEAHTSLQVAQGQARLVAGPNRCIGEGHLT